MNKYSKYLHTFFFAIAALSMIDFITRDGLDAPARYQYRDLTVEFGFFYRAIADLLLSGSLIYLLIQELSAAANKRLATIASIVYVSIIMLDMNVWLWFIQANPIYYYIVAVYTLPIVIILTKLKINIKLKKIVCVGLAIAFSGLLFDVFFINIPYPDMTDELFERTIRLEKARNLICYIGIVILTFGIIKLIKGRE